MSNVTYERVNWEDSPSENTPINQTNLNKMDKGIADCAAAVNDAQADIEDLNTETEQISENLNAKTSLKLATDATKQICFGVDASGNYGYFKDGADTVTPFKSVHLLKTVDNYGSTNGGDKYYTLNVASLLPNIYSSLTKDNFIWEPTALRQWTETAGAWNLDFTWNCSKSYNATTGVLTLLIGGGNVVASARRLEAWVKSFNIYAIY